MFKKLILGLVVVFVCSTAYAGHGVLKHNYHARKAAIHAQKANFHAARLSCKTPEVFLPVIRTPRVYIPTQTEIHVDILIPRPLKNKPHVYHGKVYKNLHYGKVNSPIHRRVITMKPY